MKMRSSTASRESGMAQIHFNALIETAKQVPQPHGEEAKHDGTDDIATGLKPFAVIGEIEGLQAERGKGGEAAEQPNHDELAHGPCRRRCGRQARSAWRRSQ